MYTCRYLSDGDDGVSEAIISFAVQYIGMLKVLLSKPHVCNDIYDAWSLLQRFNLSDTDRTNLHALLDAVINKLQYDDGYNFENEGEEEVMFLEYRKQLKGLFDTIAQVVHSI